MTPHAQTLNGRLGVKQVAWFLVKTLGIYGGLVIAYAGIGGAYSAALRDAANLALGSWGPRGKVEFRASAKGDPQGDTTVVLTNVERKRSAHFKQNSFLVGYKPTAALVALVLASPVAWPRRLRALVWGLLLVNGFVGMRMALGILSDFTAGGDVALYVLHPGLKAALSQVVMIFLDAPAMYFIAPAFIWLLVTFRRNDWARVFGKAE